MPLRRVLVRWAAWSCVGLPLGYVRSRYVKGRRLGVSSNAWGCRCVQYRFVLMRRFVAYRAVMFRSAAALRNVRDSRWVSSGRASSRRLVS